MVGTRRDGDPRLPGSRAQDYRTRSQGNEKRLREQKGATVPKMAGQDTGLKKRVVEAYEASELRQKDMETDRRAYIRIQDFLNRCGIGVDVHSNPFEIDGIRFHAYDLEDDDGIFGYSMDASQKCANCGERRIF